ncbi:MAG: rRNA maturation RNAse YbeY [Candidatus Falkowbacteria bacterium]|nr:rRNA maturation RNAse YbeY [Candidatus Falkowbacteria bacterium]
MNLEITNKTRKRISHDELKNLVSFFNKKYHLDFSELNLVFVGKGKMANINRMYRGMDRPTDVLSFSPIYFSGEEGGAQIFVCPEVVSRYRNYLAVFPDYRYSFSSRLSESKKNKLKHYLLLFVIVHGLLHLAGHDDKLEVDRLQMVRLGQKFLANHGFLIG